MSKIEMCDEGAIQLLEGIMKKAHDDYVMLWERKMKKPNSTIYSVSSNLYGMQGTVDANIDMIEKYIRRMFPDAHKKIIESLREEAAENVMTAATMKLNKKHKIS